MFPLYFNKNTRTSLLAAQRAFMVGKAVSWFDGGETSINQWVLHTSEVLQRLLAEHWVGESTVVEKCLEVHFGESAYNESVARLALTLGEVPNNGWVDGYYKNQALNRLMKIRYEIKQWLETGECSGTPNTAIRLASLYREIVLLLNEDLCVVNPETIMVNGFRLQRSKPLDYGRVLVTRHNTNPRVVSEQDIALLSGINLTILDFYPKHEEAPEGTVISNITPLFYELTRLNGYDTIDDLNKAYEAVRSRLKPVTVRFYTVDRYELEIMMRINEVLHSRKYPDYWLLDMYKLFEARANTYGNH